MKITGGILAVAMKLQEAAAELSANDTAARLRDAIADCYRGTGKWAYYIDHIGDGESGDVIYSCDSDTYRAGYSMTGTAGAAKCVIDFENALDVVPRTIWEEEIDEDDHMAAMAEAKRDNLYTEIPAYERFVSKQEREKASSGSFAGKGKSYPILKPEDVEAAARSLGRAGPGNYSTDVIKRNIIRIAKEKGWASRLPKAWQDQGGAKESQAPADAQLRLQEDAATTETIVLREARADYEIKLIAPGKGSSAFYPVEVLRRDGPQVFKAGTHVYLNHPTQAEEAARPEGDVANLAGVLTSDATYHESHAKGEGLYARMKVFADHAQMVEEKAPHVGMSIRAAGMAESGKTRDGLPVLKQLTAAQSVDVVTRAGAGGMILTESARTQPQQEATGMTEAETQKLIEAAVSPFRKRAVQADARETANRLLETVTLPPQAKARIIERALGALPLTESGELDASRFNTLIVAEAKAEGEYLEGVLGSGRVFGMGAPAPVDPKLVEQRLAEAKRQEEDAIALFESMGMPREAATFAAKGRAA